MITQKLKHELFFKKIKCHSSHIVTTGGKGVSPRRETCLLIALVGMEAQLFLRDLSQAKLDLWPRHERVSWCKAAVEPMKVEREVRAVLGSFLSMWQARVIWEEGTSIKKIPPSDCPIDNPDGAFSLLVIEVEGAQATVGSAIFGKVILGCIRKHFEHAMGGGGKPVSSSLHGLCFSFCLHFLLCLSSFCGFST